MFQAIVGLFTKNRYAKPARMLYMGLVAQARDAYFYRQLDVKDSLDGRFDMIALHLYLVLDRLEKETVAAPLGQHLVDYVISDMDRNFREMGVGDMSVGRKVQKLATALYGRLEVYQIAGDKFAEDSGARFEAALCRNVYRREAAGNLPVWQLRNYVMQQRDALSRQPVEAFLGGHIRFEPCGEEG